MKRWLFLFAALLLSATCSISAHASGSAAFVSQSAALETSTVRGLLADISAEVRGPASSYTLTIDSTSGDDIKALLVDTRYNLIECYDLSLTAVGSQEISRNPQFGDVTITIPIGSSMNPDKGTFAVYTINTDGSLQKLSCSVIYGKSTSYAVKFLTIHFSTYAIVYTSGGSTRVTGSRSTDTNSSSSSGITTITNDNTNTASGTSSDANSGAGDGGTGISSSTGSSGQTAAATDSTSSAASATTGAVAASASGKDENGKDPNGYGPYDNPKTGDRRYYGTITTAILIVAALFVLIARSKKRVKQGK